MDPKHHGHAGAAAHGFADWTRAKLGRFAGRAFSFARHTARVAGRVCRDRLQGAAHELIHSADERKQRRRARKERSDDAGINPKD
jgi:hypothetical protein